MTDPAVVDQLAGVRVLVIGDAMIDHYVLGRFDRISPEAPVPVLDVEEEFDRVGGAANAAANMVRLGGEASLLCLVGRDADETDARRLHDKCRELGIAMTGIPALPRTIRKSRMIARGQQLLRVDWDHHFGRTPEERDTADKTGTPWEPLPLAGTANDKRNAALDRLLSDADAVLVSDYAKGMVDAGLMERLRKASIPVVVDPRPQHVNLYAGVHVITPNRSEALRMLGLTPRHVLDDSETAARLADKLGSNVLLTLGAEGMLLRETSGAVTRLPSLAQEVFDPTGAGDTVAAVLGLGVGAGLDLPTAITLANAAAGEVVRHVGTVSVTPDELRRAAGRG